jgi:hypothetical protein
MSITTQNRSSNFYEDFRKITRMGFEMNISFGEFDRGVGIYKVIHVIVLIL